MLAATHLDITALGFSRGTPPSTIEEGLGHVLSLVLVPLTLLDPLCCCILLVYTNIIHLILSYQFNTPSVLTSAV